MDFMFSILCWKKTVTAVYSFVKLSCHKKANVSLHSWFHSHVSTELRKLATHIIQNRRHIFKLQPIWCICPRSLSLLCKVHNGLTTNSCSNLCAHRPIPIHPATGQSGSSLFWDSQTLWLTRYLTNHWTTTLVHSRRIKLTSEYFFIQKTVICSLCVFGIFYYYGPKLISPAFSNLKLKVMHLL